MKPAVFILLDDDFARPLYAGTEPGELEGELWQAACQHVDDALEGDGPPRGHAQHGSVAVAWRTMLKVGISFVAMAEDVELSELSEYLKEVAEKYLDEVDDVRRPDRDGVGDVVLDVVAPWED